MKFGPINIFHGKTITYSGIYFLVITYYYFLHFDLILNDKQNLYKNVLERRKLLTNL